MTGNRAAIYARYSSREQDGTSTIESQLRECRTYARHHGLTVTDTDVFIDRAKEGTTVEVRDGFKTMIVAAQRMPRPFEVILIWKFSRFARNREESAIYKGLLRRRGIEVISVTEPIDRHSATGILTEGLIEIIDQLYSARLAEDVRRGQTETALEGFSTGGQAPYGYRRLEVPDPRGRKDRTGQPTVRVTLQIEPTEAAIVRRIFETYVAGSGYKRIVLTLNREGIPGPRGGSWDISAVREILRNDAYRGVRTYGRTRKVRTAHGTRSKRPTPSQTWVRKAEAHPAIIPNELWERVRRRLDTVAEVYHKSGMAQTQLVHSQYLLTGLLQCVGCGAHFIARAAHKRKTGQRYRYYGCAFHAHRGNSVCDNRTLLPQEAIEQDLLEVLLQAVLTPENLERLLDAVNARLRAEAAASRPRIQEVQKALAKVDREIGNYTRAIAKGDFSSLETALRAAEIHRKALQAELTKIEGDEFGREVQLTPGALERHLQGMSEKLRSGVQGKVREAIQQSIGKILVDKDGTLTVKAKPGGVLGLENQFASLWCRGRGSNPHGPKSAGF